MKLITMIKLGICKKVQVCKIEVSLQTNTQNLIWLQPYILCAPHS